MDRVDYSLEQFMGDYMHVFNLGFGCFFGLNVKKRVPKGLDLGEFLKTEGFELKI